MDWMGHHKKIHGYISHTVISTDSTRPWYFFNMIAISQGMFRGLQGILIIYQLYHLQHIVIFITGDVLF